MRDDHDLELDARGLRIGIALSRYHREITDVLRAGAVDTFVGAGGDAAALVVADAPGSFEVVALSRALAARDDIDGVAALGCIIRGDTSHDQYLSHAIAHGLVQITVATGKPVAFGLITCQTRHQARERAGGPRGNRGAEAMAAVIATVASLRQVSAAPKGSAR